MGDRVWARGRYGWNRPRIHRGACSAASHLGAFAGAMGEVNGYGDVRMRVDVSYEGRPEWLEGEYAEWVEMWDT